jgi:hypothetical protein
MNQGVVEIEDCRGAHVFNPRRCDMDYTSRGVRRKIASISARSDALVAALLSESQSSETGGARWSTRLKRLLMLRRLITFLFHPDCVGLRPLDVPFVEAISVHQVGAKSW